jgi:hypothetical protein
MAAITKSEIIETALTRNISEDHILDTDISTAVAKYVTPYVTSPIDVDGSFYDNYVKKVISFGVIVDIWNRIAFEITDRGIVQMQMQGAGAINEQNKTLLKAEYSNTLNTLIEIMVAAAVDAGLDVVKYDNNLAGYSGQERVGVI